jgi:hypothetical protein
VSAVAFLAVMLAVLPLPSAGMDGMRSALRAAGVTALSTLGLALLAYCMVWRKR